MQCHTNDWAGAAHNTRRRRRHDARSELYSQAHVAVSSLRLTPSDAPTAMRSDPARIQTHDAARASSCMASGDLGVLLWAMREDKIDWRSTWSISADCMSTRCKVETQASKPPSHTQVSHDIIPRALCCSQASSVRNRIGSATISARAQEKFR